MSVCGISTKGNKEQAELIRLICDKQHPIIFCTGKAGTGKNFATLAAALQLVMDKRYGKVMYARNPVQCGENIGFLPGTASEKLDPFMAVLKDNLNAIENCGKTINAYDALQKIEILPLFSIRGRSIENTILILDECQNLDLTTIRTILTRLGKFAKIIMLGSFNQIDDIKQRKQEKCDFQKVIEKLSEFDFVGYIELYQSMRSEYCTLIDEAFEGIK